MESFLFRGILRIYIGLKLLLFCTFFYLLFDVKSSTQTLISEKMCKYFLFLVNVGFRLTLRFLLYCRPS